MQLSEIETFVVANPDGDRGGRYFIVVRLRTDDGVTGLGEVYAASFGPDRIAGLAADTFERHLEGHDPFRIEEIARRVYGSGYGLRPDPTLGAVWGGLEIALWDIIGKQTGRPVHDLLGGRVRDRVRTYTYLYPTDDHPDAYTDPTQAAAVAAEYADAGFTAVKFDPADRYSVHDGREPSLDELDRIDALTGAVREAVGTRADLLIGTHGQFTAAGAIRVARRLEAHDPLWFEEPVPPTDLAGMAAVRAATSVPVSTGERLTTLHEFSALISAGGAAILQPNVSRLGGLAAARKVAALAEAANLQIAPHLYSGPVLAAANVHFAATLPQLLILEGIDRWDGFARALTPGLPRWHDGTVEVPDRPGLGIELDDAVAAEHEWDGGPLHIEMDPASPTDPGA